MWDVRCQSGHFVRVACADRLNVVGTLRWVEIVKPPPQPFYVTSEYSTTVVCQSARSTHLSQTYRIFHLPQTQLLINSPLLLNKAFASCMLRSSARWYGNVCAVPVMPRGTLRDMTPEDCCHLRSAMTRFAAFYVVLSLTLEYYRLLLKRALQLIPLTTDDLVRLPLGIDPAKNVIHLMPIDVHLEIMSYLDLGDLIALAHSCKHFRQILQEHMLNRLHLAVRQFFGDVADEVVDFLCLHGGCIAGLLVSAVFNHQVPPSRFPRHVKLFVLQSGSYSLLRLLGDIAGFGDPEEITLQKPLNMFASSALVWNMSVSCFHSLCYHFLMLIRTTGRLQSLSATKIRSSLPWFAPRLLRKWLHLLAIRLFRCIQN